MPAQVTSLFKRLTTAVGEFSLAQRTLAIIGVAVLVLGVAAFGTWIARPAYTPLFTGLSGQDASAVVEQLRTDGVSYELADGGATILVPQESVYDQRLKAAAAGLPSADTGGYALLDQMGVTSSEFQQSVAYKRALEGELAATIAAMNGVRNASVRLAIPEETVFVSERQDPTASVFVQTQNGASLTSDQVQAIVHLTSASIEGMEPNAVAVIDADGKVLSAVGGGVAGGPQQQASDYEARVQLAVQSMLDQVVGRGNSSVVVAAEVSNQTTERLEESYTTPEGGPALSETSTSESYQGTGGGVSGVLGPDNIAVPAGEGGEGTFSSETSTRNNAVNKVTESVVIPAGSVDRQTVSVALDREAAAGIDLAGLKELVAVAAGIDPERGDAIAVEVLPFTNGAAAQAAAALQAAEEAAAAERTAAIVTAAIVAAAIALPLMLALVLWFRRSRRHSEPVDLGDLQSMKQAELKSAAPTVSMPAAAPSPPAGDIGATDVDRRRAEIGALAQQDPVRTAEYLRGLMDDRANR